MTLKPLWAKSQEGWWDDIEEMLINALFASPEDVTQVTSEAGTKYHDHFVSLVASF